MPNRHRKKKKPAGVPPPAAPPQEVEQAIPLCAICGKPITGACTIDHVIPQAIYKWHENYLERPEFLALRRSITSGRNTVRTHRRCNERKEEAIVQLEGLHISRNKRAKLRKTYRSLEPYVEAFLAHKAALLKQQEGRCYVCRAPLETGVLRRIDDSVGRTWDNACLLCHRCNCRVKSKDVKTFALTRKKTYAHGRPRRHKPKPSHTAAT